MENALNVQISHSEFELFLKGLDDLGISLENKAMLQRLFSMYQEHGFSVEDCVELAFARLRANHIEIFSPVQYQTLFQALETGQQGNEEENIPISLSAVQKRLFEGLGIISPELILSFPQTVQILTIKINDRLWPLSLTGKPSSSIVMETLYNTIAQHAAELLGMNDVEYRLAQLYVACPTLVQAVLANFTLGAVTRTLREIVRQSKSLLDIRLPLERLLDNSFAFPSQTNLD